LYQNENGLAIGQEMGGNDYFDKVFVSF